MLFRPSDSHRFDSGFVDRVELWAEGFLCKRVADLEIGCGEGEQNITWYVVGPPCDQVAMQEQPVNTPCDVGVSVPSEGHGIFQDLLVVVVGGRDVVPGVAHVYDVVERSFVVSAAVEQDWWVEIDCEVM